MSAPLADECLSDYALDHLLADELPAEDAAAVRAHLRDCSACTSRHDQLIAWQEEFAASPPPLSLVHGSDRGGAEPDPLVDDELAARRRWASRRGWWLGATAITAAAAALFFVRTGSPPTGRVALTGDGATTRSKGPARVSLYIHRDGASQLVDERSRTRPGDALQFTYTANGPVHLAVVSRDGAGAVSRYLTDGWNTAALAPGEAVPLPHSIVLDDVLGRETLYVLSCVQRTSLAPLRDALRTGSDLDEEPHGCHLRTFVLDKPLP